MPPSPRPASPRRSPPPAARRPRAPRATPRVRNTCGVCAAQSRERSSVASIARLRFATSEVLICTVRCVGPLDRVGDRGGGDHAGGLGRPRRGRRPGLRPAPASAAAGRRRGSRRSSVPTASRALATDCARVAPPGDDAEVVAAEVADVPRRRGDDDRAHRARTPGRRRSTTRPSAVPATGHEGLRAAGSEALPGAGGRDDRGYCWTARRSQWRRTAPRGGRRGIPRRRPRPCRART